MAKTEKVVNKLNLIYGACRSFKLGAHEIGGTEEGVEVEFTQEFEEHAFDESTDAAIIDPTTSNMIVRTSFAEATLENLKIAWNQASDIEEDAVEGTRTLNIGQNHELNEYTLEFIGMGPREEDPANPGEFFEYERTYTVYRAVQMSTSAHSIRKGQKVVFPVEFRVLPDDTKPKAEQYGTIVDTKITP